MSGNNAADGAGPVAAGASSDGAAAADGSEHASATATIASSGTGASAFAEAGDDHAGARISAQPPGDAQEVTEAPEVTDQEFNLAVDVIYHRARAAWFAVQHRLFLFGTIMAGSAAATDITSAKGCAFLAAALGTLDLVIDPTSRMIQHRDTARDTLAIVADLHRHDFSAEASRRARDEEFRLSASDPAPFNALRDLAFNQAVTAFGKADDLRAWIPWERRLVANLIRFEGWKDAKPRRYARFLAWLRGKG